MPRCRSHCQCAVCHLHTLSIRGSIAYFGECGTCGTYLVVVPSRLPHLQRYPAKRICVSGAHCNRRVLTAQYSITLGKFYISKVLSSDEPSNGRYRFLWMGLAFGWAFLAVVAATINSDRSNSKSSRSSSSSSSSSSRPGQ